jgi:hypothetical protein
MNIIGYPSQAQSDDCFVLNIEHYDNFKFKVPARGYNLKSWIDFEKTMPITKKVTIKKITFSEYTKLNPWATR